MTTHSSRSGNRNLSIVHDPLHIRHFHGHLRLKFATREHLTDIVCIKCTNRWRLICWASVYTNTTVSWTNECIQIHNRNICVKKKKKRPCTKKRQNLRLRGEDSVKDTFPPFLVADMEDVLYDVGQTGLRDRAVQTSLQEGGPFPLEGP